MVAGPLVDRFVDSGERLIKLLDEAGVRPRSALWVREFDSEDWSLVLATDKMKKEGPMAAYTELLAVYRANEEDLQPLRADDIVAIEPDNKLIRQHLSMFRFGPGISRYESRGNAVDGHLLPDSLIYRLQPAENGG